jgi:hypothetical protein
MGVNLGSPLLDRKRLKWKTFTEPRLDLFQCITIHHPPGHTPGLYVVQVNLEKDETFIFTTDQFHIKENYELSHPHEGSQCVD